METGSPRMQQSNPLPRVLAAVFFVGLIATAFFLNKRNVQPSGGTAAAPAGASAAPDALKRYGFRLTEVAKASGVDFTHAAPKLDPKLEPILPRVNDMGAGVAVADFDRDGWPDFYLTNSGENSANRLYRNKKDGTFEDVAGAMGVADVNRDGTGTSMGAVWGDYDNDGYEDLLVYKWGRAELFHNDAGKKFTAVTDRAGLPKWMNANTAIWTDYDCDGKLDIVLCGYFDEKLDLWRLTRTDIMPDSLEYATNGTKKYLLKGNGDGTFADVSAQVGLNTKSWTLGIGAADLRGTGYPDLFFANDYGDNELFLNEKGARFANATDTSGVGELPKSGMNVSFGDILNDGELAIYVSNISEPGLLMQGNNLWVRRPGEKVAYDNLARDMGVDLGGWSFGAQFGDLNNDGYQDIYLVNGYISASKDSYWYDYGKLTGANKLLIRDVKNWPPIKGRSLSGFQPKRVWLGDGAGKFTEVAQAVGATDRYDGRAVAVADLWNRGTLDVLVANQKGPFLLYKGETDPAHRWIAFDLEGTKANRSAVGASVTLYWDGQKQRQVVTGGIGFCAQNDRRLHFGIGKSANVEKAEIRWPGGKMQVVDRPEPGKVHKVKEA
jgi:enediyne biosynthesis protein E4